MEIKKIFMAEIKDLYKFFKNKKILITGHTGFKGSWLSVWLLKIGCDVVGIFRISQSCNITHSRTIYTSFFYKSIVNKYSNNLTNDYCAVFLRSWILTLKFLIIYILDSQDFQLPMELLPFLIYVF